MSNERAYFIALKRIAAYMDPETLLRKGEAMYGLSSQEAVAYAYENMRDEARAAIRGKRMPKEKK